MLDKAIRDLDRERMGLQNQEKKLVAEIKKTAKQGQMVSPLLQTCLTALSAAPDALDLSDSHFWPNTEIYQEPGRLQSLIALSGACRML